MALCLANSLLVKRGFHLYDQLVRYKWWFRNGYMSSTGRCFDIGKSTYNAVLTFENRQKLFAKKHKIPMENIDNLSDRNLLKQFSVYCSEDGIAGNGALMRLAPVPLFFYRFPNYAIEYSGQSGRITHGDRDVYHACRYYGALIVSALYNCKKDELLHRDFFSKNIDWFDQTKLSPNIDVISQGSFKKPGGYDEGIRGRGYIVNALEAALWAFWSDEGSFAKGALNAVNLGNDTDTTAAIYGQLAGAYYGYKKLPAYWVEHLYAKDFLLNISQWIAYESQHWQPDVN